MLHFLNFYIKCSVGKAMDLWKLLTLGGRQSVCYLGCGAGQMSANSSKAVSQALGLFSPDVRNGCMAFNLSGLE